ncbi:adenylosuccinate synthetase [Dyadobacter sp. MSC1_007]|jgi:adenylosuccinate synthase|uniref:adenylosuccinate synthetase n=1 Tax=Dyadobacter sp. MSC1_007 TaxID=2909264 RepID=UPI002030B8FA|nr:adenylosuccinate synthetase [Dyadobacter sp. MSC1_007]
MACNHIVTGLGYGDEGKGVFTDYLCSTLDKPVVIRYNGGHQCGHTVRLRDGTSHVFSNFGSGTLRNVPTFFSRFCTVDPTGIVREHQALMDLGYSPHLFVDPVAMVVTPFDKFYNTNDAGNLLHGTVGVGFGACMERNQGPCKLFAQDLFYPSIATQKLEAIRNYYREKFKNEGINSCLKALEFETIGIEKFLEDIETSRSIVHLLTESELFASGYQNMIFEGGQGVLLDMDFGVFPNMTRSNTTSKNAFAIINRNTPDGNANVYYLTRCYQTRHGNGWMSAEQYPIQLTNNELETNVGGGYQGEFRTGLLDLDMIRYALRCDFNFSCGAKKAMVISCLDQLKSYQYLSNGLVNECGHRDTFLNDIALCESVFINESPYSDTLRQWS